MALKSEASRIDFVRNLIMDGYTCQQIIMATYNWVTKTKVIKQLQRAKIVMLVSDCEKNSFEGANEEINLIMFFDSLSNITKSG